MLRRSRRLFSEPKAHTKTRCAKETRQSIKPLSYYMHLIFNQLFNTGNTIHPVINRFNCWPHTLGTLAA
jgi:hypothetical protein